MEQTKKTGRAGSLVKFKIKVKLFSAVSYIFFENWKKQHCNDDQSHGDKRSFQKTKSNSQTAAGTCPKTGSGC